MSEVAVKIEVPEEWVSMRLDECAEILDSMRIPLNSKQRSERIDGKSKDELYPYYGATGQVGFIDDFLFEGEHLLIGEDGAPFFDKSKNVAYISKGKFWVNNHAHILNAIGGITTNKYLLHYLNNFNYTGYVGGTTRLKLNQGNLKKIPVPIAPLEQQKRIVAKIEELFSHIDAGIEALKKAKQLLKQYRQSVLKAAVTGELTKEWRQANKDKLEPADQLLERILKDRRQKWEEQQLEQFKAKGLPAPKKEHWWLYVILCDDKSFYIGVTEDMPRRWKEHASGKGAEHTKKHKPDLLVHHEEFKSQKEAYSREKELKTGFGRKWLKREYEKGALRQAGKMPKDDKWKGKYKEPVAVESLPFEIPEGWATISLDTLIHNIEAGKSFKCDERPPLEGEAGIVKVSAVTWGEFNSGESKTITDKGKINPNYRINEGDFLFSRANTIELIGACVIVKNVEKDLLLSDKIHRFIIPEEWKGWVRLCLRSRHGRNEIESLATGNQDSMRNISQGNVKSIRVPLLPVIELKEVIALGNKKIDGLQRLESEIEIQLVKSEKNKQSILASAFSGKITNG